MVKLYTDDLQEHIVVSSLKIYITQEIIDQIKQDIIQKWQQTIPDHTIFTWGNKQYTKKQLINYIRKHLYITISQIKGNIKNDIESLEYVMSIKLDTKPIISNVILDLEFGLVNVPIPFNSITNTLNKYIEQHFKQGREKV